MAKFEKGATEIVMPFQPVADKTHGELSEHRMEIGYACAVTFFVEMLLAKTAKTNRQS